MGREVAALARDDPGLVLAAAIDAPGHPDLGRPLTDARGRSAAPVLIDLAAWDASAAAPAVVVDFSVPPALRALLERLVAHPLPLVCGTTGLGREEEALLDELSRRAPVLHAPNMSVGVAAVRAACAGLARALGEGFDVEVLEVHHGAKRDAPSGTALALVQAIGEGRGTPVAPSLDRTTRGRVREPGSVGVAALRGGGVVGEHSVFFLGEDERVEVVHRATSRRLFARGALRAARWIAGRPPGRCRIDDVLSRS
jgi:4-hydroxy-tetrahydrodipicolinate reductase